MRVIFLTGSGLSADSGLKTFRGHDGLYAGMRAEEVLSARNYRRNPDQVESFLSELRASIAAAEPNDAHRGIAQYCSAYPDSVVITQNVDDLLERAGVPEVIHLHGNIRSFYCLGHAHRVPVPDGVLLPEGRCPSCRSRLRSDVVLFEEAAPEYFTLRKVIKKHHSADVLVVIGTQGIVIPVAQIAGTFRGKKILNNLHASDAIPEVIFDAAFLESAATAFPKIRALLDEWRNSFLSAGSDAPA